jgi:hypothetical protein
MIGSHFKSQKMAIDDDEVISETVWTFNSSFQSSRKKGFVSTEYASTTLLLTDNNA